MLRILALVFALFAGPAFAADNMFPTPGNALAPGAVIMCQNASGLFVPCTPGAGSVAVVSAPYPYTPLTSGQYTPVSDAAATSLTIPTGATYAVICVEGSQHRYTWDGTTTPTASIGSLMAQGPSSCLSLSGAASLAAFKIIAVSAGGTFTASYAK